MIPNLSQLLPNEPGWLSWAAPLATVLIAVAVALWGVRRLRGSAWLAGIGPQAIVALGGVAVSVYGLWGFATETVHLPKLLAVAFISVFDAAEMTLLVMLYRTADPAVGWTRELHLMHRTAWTLVGFSGAMNAVHAPNWWARPVLAAVPALAAWLIELQLRSKLHSPKPDADEEGARPGPARLVALLWQHAWSGLFALLGLDARTSSSAIARAALAQRAALRVYRLRLALEDGAPAGRPRAARRVERRREKLRGRAQKALDRADVATDPGQSLALVRRLAALTRAEEVARLNYSDTTAVLALIEDLAVTPGAQRIESSALAEQAEDARKRAEAARQEADDARQEAEAARQRAEEALTAAREELARVEEARDAALEDESGVAEQARGARQRAEDARKAEQAARQRAAEVLKTAQADAERLRTEAAAGLEEVRGAITEQQEVLSSLTRQAQQARDEASGRQEELSQVSRDIEEATLIRDRLRGDLAALSPQAPDGASSGEGPVYKSPAKEQGWQHYLHTLTTSEGRAEPTAAELAERFGVDGGNARNWLRDFRAARAAQLAAHQPRAAAHHSVNGSAPVGIS
ncbi:hypothetical protein CP981_11190 [Streptomyces platensis]|uniref:Chromosome partition protein Smc n=1 Tax=Streptomyces platensis TaxID=58346 RepID=A0AAE6TLV8_STRPT|nr:hypothetical protein [Streptomyces platensis]OSY35955.1 Chromosome partition protein Smc [Streptomyces platensis]QEV52156.1 hypothetical protein CP981_11190 [Streptomyces platensis]